MAVVTRTGKKQVTRKKGKTTVVETVEVGHKHIEVKTPGWGRGLFRMGAHTTDGRVAQDYDRMVRELYHGGALECLDALKAKEISLPVCYVAFSAKGVAGALEKLREIRNPKSGPPPLAAEVEAWLQSDMDAKASTREQYRTHLARFIAEHGGEDTCTVQSICDRDELLKHYRKLIEDGVAVKQARVAGQDAVALHRNGTRNGQPRLSKRRMRRSPRLRPTDEDSLRKEATSTANRHLSSIRGFLYWALAARGGYGLITVNPARSSRRKEDGIRRGSETVPDYTGLAPDELTGLRGAARAIELEDNLHADTDPLPDLLLIDLLTETGCRTFREGIDRLCMAQFDRQITPQGVQVTILTTKTEGKGVSKRPVWVSAGLYQRLREHQGRYGLKLHEPLFSRAAEDGSGVRVPFSKDRVERFFYRCCARAVADNPDLESLRYYRVYNLRHTFARRFLAATPDLSLLAQAMGHTVVETTMRYARYRDANALARAMAAATALAPLNVPDIPAQE